MPELFLHHVSIPSTDLDRSVAFYRDVLGLGALQRPPFKSAGAWLACGAQQVHLNLKPASLYGPEKVINPTEPHFALRADDFDAMLLKLRTAGFSDSPDAPPERRMMIDRDGVAGFPQLFIVDPDRNTVEINAAA